MPVTMTKTPPTTVRIPEAIKDAAQEWCDQHGASVAQAMLEGLLMRIGREDLRDQLPKMGRPRHDEPAQKPVKKKRSRKK